MVKITNNGIETSKGDIFNLLCVPSVWDNNATYTCKITASGVSVDVECSLFRNKYVRLYKNPLNLKEGTYTLTLKKGDQEVMTKYVMIKEVAHNE